MTKKTKGVFAGLTTAVLAGVIVELVTDISVLNVLWSAVAATGNCLNQSVTLPLWGAILLSLSGLTLVGLIVVFLAARSGTDPDQLHYTSDYLLGLKWRWDYSRGGPTDVVPFCPRCDYQPVLQEVYGEATKVKCDNCGFSKEYDMHPFEVRDRAIRHIQRNLRTGEYKTSLPKKNT